jgi:hypothetical protein
MRLLFLGLLIFMTLGDKGLRFMTPDSSFPVWQRAAWSWAPEPAAAADPESLCPRELLLAVNGVPIWSLRGEAPFFYKSRMRVDADGAPNAYHPEDKGLDLLQHAGSPGNWQGLVTDDRGRPLIQGPFDPYPGYYLSQTSLFNKNRKRTDPACYVDARTIPYIVLPGEPGLTAKSPVRLGDFAVVVNVRNRRIAGAIFADRGPRGKIGEGSIALAELLQIPSSPRTGGLDGDIIYVVFPGSGNGRPHSPREIARKGEQAFKAWGGLPRLAACFPECRWDEKSVTFVRPK